MNDVAVLSENELCRTEVTKTETAVRSIQPCNIKEATDGQTDTILLLLYWTTNNDESISAVQMWTGRGQTVRWLRGRRGQKWGCEEAGQAARCAVSGMGAAGGSTVQPAGRWTRTKWCKLYLEWTGVVCAAELRGTWHIGRPEQQWKDQ